MRSIDITPSTLKGNVVAPPSKSLGHRAVICASLAAGQSKIHNCPASADLSATVNAMKTLGASIRKDGSLLTVDGSGIFSGSADYAIDCFESGSTLRFLIPVAALSGRKVSFTGRGRLAQRPLDPYIEAFTAMDIRTEVSEEGLPLTVYDKLKPGKYSLRGDVSSQFVSGLLLALPLLDGDSAVELTTDLESRPYVEMTLDVLSKFGVSVESFGSGLRHFRIKGGQKYRPADYTVEGDYSQAAFWLAAGALDGGVCCEGLKRDSLQGDKEMLRIIEALGYAVAWEDNLLKACASSENPKSPAGRERKTVIDCSQIPDIVPIAAALAALTQGVTVFSNAARLRLKESDRMSSITAGLKALGADIRETHDTLKVKGADELKGGTADACGDHRIAMSLAIAAVRCRNKVTIIGHDCVDKSYPDFWTDYMNLGGLINERDLGK